jgi:DNA polymerase (family X)
MALDRRAATEALARVAFAAELLEDPRVDARTASTVAWALRSVEGSTDALFADGAFERIDGMSAPLWAVVDDALHERTPALLDELERLLPRGILELRAIKGLGPKKIRALWKDLEITSVGELEYACRENRLVTLKGFGDKTQASVMEQIAALRAQAGRMRLDDARDRSERLRTLLHAQGAADVHVAGALRRGAELVAALRLVARCDPDAATRALQTLAADLGEAHVRIAREDADGSVRVTMTAGPLRAIVRAVARATQLGVAVLDETGGPVHVDLVRSHAAARGVTFAAIEATTDDAVYDALGLLPTAPERREPGVPLVERGHVTPRLVERADLRGALHNHTDASDGTATLEEMRAAAIARGLAYLGITDHSKSASYAHGLQESALEAQRARIDALNRDADGSRCALLSGVESDILRDGALDYEDHALRPLDVVVASVHNRFGQRGEPMTARMLAAARHPMTDIVGHPTGRLLLGRAPVAYDVSALLAACAERGCAVELNANPARLDLSEQHLAEAKDRGVLVSIAADAHAPDELDALEWGILIARRAGLTPEDVLNTRDLASLRVWLKARRARAGAA